MKKLLTLTFILFTALLLVGCSKKETLKLYIPNEYIDKDLIKQFQKEHGVKVKVITFDSNEVAIGQMKSNNYDVAVPSDYAIEELAKDGLLEKINYDDYIGEGFELAPGLASFIEELSNEGFNFKDYAIPYFWGSLGILYNPDKVSLERLEEEGYGVIADNTLETILYESSRDAFMAGLLVNGKELHDSTRDETTLKDDLLQAENWLKNAVKKGSKTSILSDQILTDMLRGDRYDAVISYSGDAAYIMEENDNYNFYNPTNTNVFADGFVVLKNSEHKELAKKFIKFMTTYDSALANTLEVGYTAARLDVFNKMIEDEEYYGDERLKVAYEVNLNEFQVFRHDAALKTLIDEAWARVLAAQGK